MFSGKSLKCFLFQHLQASAADTGATQWFMVSSFVYSNLVQHICTVALFAPAWESSLFCKGEIVCVCVWVSHPFLSEVNASGTLLGSEYTVSLSWSRSTLCFHHPDGSNKETSWHLSCARISGSFTELSETHLSSNVKHVRVRVVERKEDSRWPIQVLLYQRHRQIVLGTHKTIKDAQKRR